MRFASVLIAACLGALPATASAQGFEGVQEFRITNEDGKTGTVTQIQKGSRVRMDFAGLAAMSGGRNTPQFAGAYSLIDWKTKEMYMVMPSQKMYMTANLDSLSARNAEGKKGKPAGVTKTGRTETVGGIKCEIYTFTTTMKERPQDMEACLARGSGIMAPAGAAGMGRRSGPIDPALEALVRQGYGVVKLSRVSDGVASPVVELLKQERKSVPASEMEVPASFMKMDMGAMMGGGRPRN